MRPGEMVGGGSVLDAECTDRGPASAPGELETLTLVLTDVCPPRS